MYRKIYFNINNNIIKYSYHTSVIKLSKYSDTVLLPKTKFPQRLTGKKLLDQSKLIYEKCGFDELYSWQRDNLKGSEFILHDGPPYANGLPHMGHAINKILKDVINRYHITSGNRINYIPGWDCHGLPIELKALSKSNKKSNNTDNTPLHIRTIARNFASETVQKQRDIFKSWGVTGDWDNAYLTYSVPYVKNQIKQFYNLYKKKLIYRAVKPVYWSPSSRTALAEAELEYNEKHKSTATIVRFKLNHIPDSLQLPSPTNSNVYALIWTTTPWTLPSNQAICYNPKLSYSLVKANDSCIYIIATDLIDSVSKTIDKELQVISTFSGDKLEKTTYKYPFKNNELLPFLPGDHATASKGTGLVHTAPAHGPDDFVLALKHNIPVKCIVNEIGCYTNESDHFNGLSVLKDGNEAVIKYLKDDVLNVSDYIHSYPYDWRTKKPIILRASQQWFIDTNSIKEKAVQLLEDVSVYPEKSSAMFKANFISQIRKRPYWCISRQRVWGVPIPVFYNKTTNEPIITESLVNHLCDLLEKHNIDYWWTLTNEELIPDAILQEINLTLGDLKKSQDILDIWFDSGISWSSVFQDDNNVADVYLEGVDQFTGWFQSSLMTSVALREKTPYKTIYVHGFAVDEKGHKMSKSLGNVIDPQAIVNGAKGQPAYGIDTLRWWVICHASQDSLTSVTQNVLQSSADQVQKIRNTLRFALSNLNDYTAVKNDDLQLKIIDKYMLHLLYEFDDNANEMYKNYQFNKLCIALINLVTNPISALYYSVIKDRLYCESVDNPSRRATQFVLDKILNVISKVLAPITPHLVEELYMYRNVKTASTFFKSIDQNWLLNDYHQPKIAETMENVLGIKRDLNKLGNTSEMKVDLIVSKDFYSKLQIFESKDELAEILQVSNINKIEPSNIQENYTVNVSKTDDYMCSRCKRYSSINDNSLCNRCYNVLMYG